MNLDFDVVRREYIRSLGIESRGWGITLDRLQRCRSDEARRLLLKFESASPASQDAGNRLRVKAVCDTAVLQCEAGDPVAEIVWKLGMALKGIGKRKGTMKTDMRKGNVRLPKGPKAKPVKSDKQQGTARIEAMMRIAGKR